MGRKRRPRKVYQEEAKQRQVSHWDLDYLPKRQIDKVTAAGTPQPSAATEQRQSTEDQGSWGSRIWHALGRMFGAAP